MNRSTFFVRLAVLTALVGIANLSFGQEQAKKTFPGIKIKNFGQMDERFYRGAQPKESDYNDLAQLGVKTVIDLQDDPKDYEKRAVEALGMQYINIPMSDTKYPDASKIDQFLKLTDDPATGKFYVHCAGGRHRTGVIGAVYRFNHDHWNYDQAYAEMKVYDFYTRWGHGPMKQFVEDYWKQRESTQTPVSTQNAAAKK